MKKALSDVSRETFLHLINQHISSFGVTITDNEADVFFRFWIELLRWNKTHNLTTITETEKAVDGHFIDSLLPAADFELFKSFSKVLDLGTGAGFPGIPLSVLFPETEYYLLDKSHKKISFLQIVSGFVNLKNVFPVQANFFSHLSKYDAVVSRAVKLDDEIYLHCRKIINPGGYLIVYLSSNQTPYPSKELSFLRHYPFAHTVRSIAFYHF